MVPPFLHRIFTTLQRTATPVHVMLVTPVPAPNVVISTNVPEPTPAATTPVAAIPLAGTNAAAMADTKGLEPHVVMLTNAPTEATNVTPMPPVSTPTDLTHATATPDSPDFSFRNFSFLNARISTNVITEKIHVMAMQAVVITLGPTHAHAMRDTAAVEWNVRISTSVPVPTAAMATPVAAIPSARIHAVVTTDTLVPEWNAQTLTNVLVPIHAMSMLAAVTLTGRTSVPVTPDTMVTV